MKSTWGARDAGPIHFAILRSRSPPTLNVHTGTPRAGGSLGPRLARHSGRHPMLELGQVTAGYGHFTALWDVSLRVAEGEAVAVVGPNGAGKTTLLRVISGLIAPRSGRITFEGAEVAGHPAYDIVAHGVAHVPEGRRLFPGLTVADPLKMGAFP